MFSPLPTLFLTWLMMLQRNQQGLVSLQRRSLHLKLIPAWIQWHVLLTLVTDLWPDNISCPTCDFDGKLVRRTDSGEVALWLKRIGLFENADARGRNMCLILQEGGHTFSKCERCVMLDRLLDLTWGKSLMEVSRKKRARVTYLTSTVVASVVRR